ncbi:MAG: hypothetical protein M3511_10960 [Deinococcota bacterium]|nr:hypothetical protein [Deinococcota bacterium]
MKYLTERLLAASRSGALIALVFAAQLGSILWLRALGARFVVVTGGLEPFDFQNGLTAEGIFEQLPAYTDASRVLYHLFAAVDFLFPALASLFSALLLAWSLRSLAKPWSERLLRLHTPALLLLTALWDWLENIFLLVVINAYPQELLWAAEAAILFKRLKLGFLFTFQPVVIVLATVAGIVSLRRRCRCVAT